MRIDPTTGEILSEDDSDDDFCPYCHCVLRDVDYEWCEVCDEYIGVVIDEDVIYNMNQVQYNRKVDEMENQLKEIIRRLNGLK